MQALQAFVVFEATVALLLCHLRQEWVLREQVSLLVLLSLCVPFLGYNPNEGNSSQCQSYIKVGGEESWNKVIRCDLIGPKLRSATFTYCTWTNCYTKHCCTGNKAMKVTGCDKLIGLNLKSATYMNIQRTELTAELTAELNDEWLYTSLSTTLLPTWGLIQMLVCWWGGTKVSHRHNLWHWGCLPCAPVLVPP